MIIGNQQAQQTLSLYFDHIKTQQLVDLPFLLLTGPTHIGKTVCVETLLKDLLGEYMSTDYLALYDLSEVQGKHHALKVEVPAKEQHQEIEGSIYANLGTRDMVQWLSLAPAGRYKVIYLENVERMTISAANAFLKTLEEPLPGRIIIATTSYPEGVLDTLLSRALIVPFQLPSMDEARGYLDINYADLEDALRHFVLSFSCGRIGLMEQMLQDLETIKEYSVAFNRILDLELSPGTATVERYQILQQFSKRGILDQLVDAMVYALSDQQKYTKTGGWFEAKRLLDTNVGVDNILFALALK